MKRNELFPWAAIAAVSFAACEAPADNPPVRSANTPGADSIADAPTADALLALDRQANEAFFKGDAAYFAAFHGENPIFDPRVTEAPPAEAAAREEAPNTNDEAAPDAGPAASAADPSTDAMVAIETSVWEAWKERDAIALEELTARNLAFVDIFGNVTSGKAETIRFWTEHQCDVQSVRVADGTGTSLSSTVGILTFKGILEGTCGGQEFPLIHGTSVHTREGDAWKLAFTMNQLAN